MRHVKNPVTLNLVIYNEPVQIIKRCLDSVHDIVDYIVVYAHEIKSDLVCDYILKIYNPEEFIFSTADLDDTVVEEWRNKMMDESPSAWVLILDPDEYLDDGAREEVNQVRFGDRIMTPYDNIVGVVWARKNYERTEDGMYVNMVNYPDKQLRLVKKDHVTYSGKVHKAPKIGAGNILLAGRGHIIHDKHYESMIDWHRKEDLYRRKAD